MTAVRTLTTRAEFEEATSRHPVAVLDVGAGFVGPAFAVSPKAGVTCADPDDQKFIDLAVVHRATLLSKDRAVLCMAKRLHAQGVRVASALPL